MNDLRFAFRQLLHSPGFAIASLLAIALGISTVTTMFTFFNAILLRPMPCIPEQERLLRVKTWHNGREGMVADFSIPLLQDFRAGSRLTQGAFMTWDRTYIFGERAVPERVLGAWISADGLRTVGVKPVLGRLFTPEEEAGGAKVAVLSHEIWSSRYQRDPQILQRLVVLNGEDVKVVGVMPEGFRFPSNHDVWMPFRHEDEKMEERANLSWPVWTRLVPGAGLEEASREANDLARQLARKYPETDRNLSFRLASIRADETEKSRSMLQLLLGAVLAVQLIACANVANLLLARGAVRFREVTIRAALGADRMRLIRQLLTESLMLAVAGGALGILMSYWVVDWLLVVSPQRVPFWLRFEIDSGVLIFATATALVSSLVFGLLPALQLSKTDLHTGLKEGGRAAAGTSRARRMRNALVVLQLALTMVLLVSAGLMVRSFLREQNMALGMDPQNVFTFRVGLPPTQFPEKGTSRAFFGKLEAELGGLPGVEKTAFIDMLPLQGKEDFRGFNVEGRPRPESISDLPVATCHLATSGVFEVLRIPLVRGRYFNAGDIGEKAHVAVVDEVFVKTYFPNEDPLGKRIAWAESKAYRDKEKWLTIIGVTAPIKPHPNLRIPQRVVWQPLPDDEDAHFLSAMLRVKGNPGGFAAPAQAAVLRCQPGIPIYSTLTMEQLVQGAFWERRFFALSLSIFAAVSVLLAAIGIYGIMAYSVSQRRREIGIRMALGARSGDVLAMLLGQGARLVGTGLAAGLIGAVALSQGLGDQVQDLSSRDTLTFLIVTVLLAAVAFLACYLPSRRATLIEPMEALRAE